MDEWFELPYDSAEQPDSIWEPSATSTDPGTAPPLAGLELGHPTSHRDAAAGASTSLALEDPWTPNESYITADEDSANISSETEPREYYWADFEAAAIGDGADDDEFQLVDEEDVPEQHRVDYWAARRRLQVDSMAADFSEGRLETTVGSPQRELSGTKDQYVSYLVTTDVCASGCLYPLSTT